MQAWVRIVGLIAVPIALAAGGYAVINRASDVSIRAQRVAAKETGQRAEELVKVAVMMQRERERLSPPPPPKPVYVGIANVIKDLDSDPVGSVPKYKGRLIQSSGFIREINRYEKRTGFVVHRADSYYAVKSFIGCFVDDDDLLASESYKVGSWISFSGVVGEVSSGNKKGSFYLKIPNCVPRPSEKPESP